MNYRDAIEKITTPRAAKEAFELLVCECMKESGKTRATCEDIQRQNLGYIAGYYDHATRLRVERLYSCVHPIFGAAINGEPSPKEAFELGMQLGKAAKEKEDQ